MKFDLAAITSLPQIETAKKLETWLGEEKTRTLEELVVYQILYNSYSGFPLSACSYMFQLQNNFRIKNLLYISLISN